MSKTQVSCFLLAHSVEYYSMKYVISFKITFLCGITCITVKSDKPALLKCFRGQMARGQESRPAWPWYFHFQRKSFEAVDISSDCCGLVLKSWWTMVLFSEFALPIQKFPGIPYTFWYNLFRNQLCLTFIGHPVYPAFSFHLSFLGDHL